MRALLVKTSSLGDVIHAFPVVQLLTSQGYRVDWVVEQSCAELVRAHPDVETVHVVDTRRWRRSPLSRKVWSEYRAFRDHLQSVQYDVVFDLQGNIKSGLITRLADAAVKVGFGSESVAEYPNIWFTDTTYDPPKGGNIRDDLLSLPRQHLGLSAVDVDNGVVLTLDDAQRDLYTAVDLGVGEKIMVCPGSRWRNKMVSKEALRDLLARIASEREAVFHIVWGNEEERRVGVWLQQNVGGDVRLFDRVSLPVLQKVMSDADLVIAMDSLALHLAGTTLTPTYSVFGPSSMMKYRPVGNHHHALQGRCPYGVTFENRCPQLRTCKSGACTKDLSGDDLRGALMAPRPQLSD